MVIDYCLWSLWLTDWSWTFIVNLVFYISIVCFNDSFDIFVMLECLMMMIGVGPSFLLSIYLFVIIRLWVLLDNGLSNSKSIPGTAPM